MNREEDVHHLRLLWIWHDPQETYQSLTNVHQLEILSMISNGQYYELRMINAGYVKKNQDTSDECPNCDD